MFLTTNRLRAIDKAFLSRIHLCIGYPPLVPESRRELWTTFIVAASKGKRPKWLTKSFLDRISSVKANGREIRNFVRIALALADSTKPQLMAEDILAVLSAVGSFKDDGFHEPPKRPGSDSPKVRSKRLKLR